MPQRTALYENHLAMGAKIVDFSGWEMPIHYGSQIEEHHAVRRDAGMFDVSHMTTTDLHGKDVRAMLSRLLANNVDKLQTPGKALYSCMLAPDAGILDDLIVYYMNDDWFRVVSNAATRDKDLAWIRKTAEEFDEVIIKVRDDVSMIAVQGPNAKEKVYATLGESLRDTAGKLTPFNAIHVGELFIATTGYTGEEGFEIIMPSKAAPFAWDRLAEVGVAPAGLGARDTLRLEAGMCLYGSDMDESTHPLESGLAWTIGWEPQDRDFIGREALERRRADGVDRKLAGLVLLGKGVLRGHQKVDCGEHGAGEVTSGSFSPTLERSIALARIPAAVPPGALCHVDIRGKAVEARATKFPFVRNGKSCLD